MCLRVGFYKSGTYNIRGDTIALFDYAHFNETILHNKSFIIVNKNNNHTSFEKFKNRFDNISEIEDEIEIHSIIENLKLTHLYIPKYGNKDGIIDVKCKLLVHCVFESRFPHGDKCAVVGSTINNIYNTNLPVVNHIINIPSHNENLRFTLNIPEDAVVFGRYGGNDSFDIPFVKEVIKYVVNTHEQIYFIFMNTDIFYKHDRIIYMEKTHDMHKKRQFINTSDALIHARYRGETFGLTCGEFATCKKQILSFSSSIETEHLHILNDKVLLYKNPEELYNILINLKDLSKDMANNGYITKCNPEYIMERFNNVFLT